MKAIDFLPTIPPVVNLSSVLLNVLWDMAIVVMESASVREVIQEKHANEMSMSAMRASIDASRDV